MERVDTDDVTPVSAGDSDLDRRALSDPLGTTDLAINRYVLEPGEGFSGGLHAHLDQEEVFYVVDGTATFEHRPDATADTETVEVGPGEAIRFPPGEFQQGRNEGDERVVALALGGPKESSEVRIPLPCRECDSDVLAVDIGADGSMSYECPDCGTAADL